MREEGLWPNVSDKKVHVDSIKSLQDKSLRSRGNWDVVQCLFLVSLLFIRCEVELL